MFFNIYFKYYIIKLCVCASMFIYVCMCVCMYFLHCDIHGCYFSIILYPIIAFINI